MTEQNIYSGAIKCPALFSLTLSESAHIQNKSSLIGCLYFLEYVSKNVSTTRF